ncbi:MAG: hypothetical protein HS118_00885 [Bacteroidia bacterium]|nr:hypothetical protein [Bacteroidia bacterium]
MILENDVNFSAYTPLDYITKVSRKNYTGEYLKGDSQGDIDPSYSGPEGFSGTPFSVNTPSETFDTPNLSTSVNAPPPVMDVRMVNANYDGYFHTFNVAINGNQVFTDNNIFGYTRYDFNFTLSLTALAANNTLQFSGIANGGGSNRMSVTYYNLRYAHANTFSGESTPFQFFSVSGSGSKLRVDLNDYLNSDNTPRYIYLLAGDTISKITTVRTGNLCRHSYLLAEQKAVVCWLPNQHPTVRQRIF